jgi:hypothetical protein
MYAGGMNDEYVEFSAMTLSEKDTIDSGVGNYASTNSVFKFTNGAVFNQSGSSLNIKGTNVTFAVESGSSLSYRYMTLGSAIGDALVVDDAFLTVTKLSVDTAAHLDNVNMRIAGANPTITVKEAILLDTESVAGNNDLTITFNVPNGGYTNEVVLSSISANVQTLGSYLNPESTGKIIVRVDPMSEQLRGGAKLFDNHIILWQGGIDTNNVIVEANKKVEFNYTYGWPSEALVPSEDGELPTGLRCRIYPTAATLITIY